MSAKTDELRRCIQLYLVDRSAAKMRPSAILSHAESEGHRVTEEALETELDFLERDGWLEKSYAPGGTVPRYQASTKLIIARQRGEF
jgi:hypothetical protein